MKYLEIIIIDAYSTSEIEKFSEIYYNAQVSIYLIY